MKSENVYFPKTLHLPWDIHRGKNIAAPPKWIRNALSEEGPCIEKPLAARSRKPVIQFIPIVGPSVKPNTKSSLHTFS
jgi:hypothetical protein